MSKKEVAGAQKNECVSDRNSQESEKKYHAMSGVRLKDDNAFFSK